MNEPVDRSYPHTIVVGELQIELRPMTRADEAEVLAFAQRLPRHDLLFLRRDITRPEGLGGWLRDIEAGHVTTLLARHENALVGYATMHRSELGWSAHVAELRIVVAPDYRGKGLGRALTQEIFALAIGSGIEKLVARMTLDQKGAIATFEGLGFRPEALMRDHVKDLDGNSHDLIVMSHAVEEFQQTLDAYGVPESLGVG